VCRQRHLRYGCLSDNFSLWDLQGLESKAQFSNECFIKGLIEAGTDSKRLDTNPICCLQASFHTYTHTNTHTLTHTHRLWKEPCSHWPELISTMVIFNLVHSMQPFYLVNIWAGETYYLLNNCWLLTRWKKIEK
jgi:hypothetical protein